MDFPEFDRVRTAAQSDERAWRAEYGVSRDVAGLGVERNVLRYRPARVVLRLSQSQPLAHLVRLIAAAARTGSTIDISSAVPLPTGLVQSFGSPVPPVSVASTVIESDAQWLARAPGLGVDRIRLIGGDPAALAGRRSTPMSRSTRAT